MREKVYDLEDRLIEFGARVANLVEALPKSRAGNYMAGQLIRCGLAPALNYGEAQGAESREDFVHKMKVVLKELKEARVCLKLIKRQQMIKPAERLSLICTECEELISIVAKSIETAKKNITSAQMTT